MEVTVIAVVVDVVEIVPVASGIRADRVEGWVREAEGALIGRRQQLVNQSVVAGKHRSRTARAAPGTPSSLGVNSIASRWVPVEGHVRHVSHRRARAKCGLIARLCP